MEDNKADGIEAMRRLRIEQAKIREQILIEKKRKLRKNINFTWPIVLWASFSILPLIVFEPKSLSSLGFIDASWNIVVCLIILMAPVYFLYFYRKHDNKTK